MSSTLFQSMLKLCAILGLAGGLASCSSTDLAGKGAGKDAGSFALASTVRSQPVYTPNMAVSQNKQSKTKGSASDLKAKLAKAKIQAEKDAKQLASFDKMSANLGDTQKQFLKSQRDALAKKANASQGEVSKLEIALAPPPVGGKGSTAYHGLIAKYAKAYGVPIKLAHAVIRVESGYRANARGKAGEIGLMQLKHSTARGMGYRGSAKGLYNPETNIKYGMMYLGKAHSLAGGSTCGTILKYNAGHGAKRMNPVSKNYCNKVARFI